MSTNIIDWVLRHRLRYRPCHRLGFMFSENWPSRYFSINARGHLIIIDPAVDSSVFFLIREYEKCTKNQVSALFLVFSRLENIYLAHFNQNFLGHLKFVSGRFSYFLSVSILFFLVLKLSTLLYFVWFVEDEIYIIFVAESNFILG